MARISTYGGGHDISTSFSRLWCRIVSRKPCYQQRNGGGGGLSSAPFPGYVPELCYKLGKYTAAHDITCMRYLCRTYSK